MGDIRRHRVVDAGHPQIGHNSPCSIAVLGPSAPTAALTTAATATATAATTTATAATAAPTYCAPMASLRVLAFDHKGRPIQFDTWLNDLQLYLLSDSKDSVSLFDLATGAATAPPAIADSGLLATLLPT
ncbi:unnamed protein product [Closterium sp. NIES-54]